MPLKPKNYMILYTKNSIAVIPGDLDYAILENHPRAKKLIPYPINMTNWLTALRLKIKLFIFTG
jgi:hypothetical protein